MSLFFSLRLSPVIKNFNSDDRHEIRSIISNSVVKFKKKFSVPSLLPISIKLLKKDPSYVFTKADKGRCIVLNRSECNSKVLDHLSDSSTYELIKRD